MGYQKEVYDAVTRKLEQKRLRAGREAEERRAEFYRRCPRAAEIERELSSTAVAAARAVLGGGDVSGALQRLKERNLAQQEELSRLLSSCGLARDALEPHYACPSCEDTGYVDGVMCSCMKQELRREAYERLSSLSPLELSSFESFSLDYYSDVPVRGELSPRRQMEAVLRYCRGYAARFSLSAPSLLMQGATGLGKTHLSLAIASEAIAAGYGVVYGSTPSLVSQLEKERFRPQRDEAGESERHLIGCDLLILDDLGTEFSTSFSNAAIYNILNSRIMVGRPTIISTNLSAKELEQQYSERLVSRIMGNHVRLEFLGGDVRLQKRLNRKSK